MLQYTGGSLKDHLGPRWLSHMHPDDQPECRKAWEVAFEQGNGFSGEYRLRRFDDLYRYFLIMYICANEELEDQSFIRTRILYKIYTMCQTNE